MKPAPGNADTPSLGASMDEALAWVARLRDNRAGRSKRAVFDSWLRSSPKHAEAYAKVEALWQAPELTAALGRFADEAIPPAKPKHPPGLHPQRLAIAATIPLLVGWSLVATGLIDRWRADYTTVTGEQRRITLFGLF